MTSWMCLWKWFTCEVNENQNGVRGAIMLKRYIASVTSQTMVLYYLGYI